MALCDMQDYLDLTTNVEPSDFLITLAGAFSDQLRSPQLLGEDFAQEGYWTRFVNYVKRTKIEIKGLEASAQVDGAGLKLKGDLKEDPSFRQRLQEGMKGHLSTLVADVRSFMDGCVKALKEKHGGETEVVLLLDSLEQIRGTSINADEVYSSVETLFFNHSDKLHFRYLHLVYTVPPWLKIRVPAVGGRYHGFFLIPCVRVHDQRGEDVRAGLDGLEDVVRRRGDWQRLLGSRAVLDRLIRSSGGYLRDLFRLLRTCLLRVRQSEQLPLDERAIELAIAEIRNSYLPLTNEDARWLARVEDSHESELPSGKELSELPRFFDTHLILCYRNGDEWYDVHPLIVETVRGQAERAAGREDGDHAPLSEPL